MELELCIQMVQGFKESSENKPGKKVEYEYFCRNVGFEENIEYINRNKIKKGDDYKKKPAKARKEKIPMV